MGRTVSYRNPFAFELFVARVVGWLLFLVWVAFFTVLALPTLKPVALEGREVWLGIVLAIVSIFVGAAEARAEEQFAEFETKMQIMLGGGERR